MRFFNNIAYNLFIDATKLSQYLPNPLYRRYFLSYYSQIYNYFFHKSSNHSFGIVFNLSKSKHIFSKTNVIMKIGLNYPKTYYDWSNFTSKCIPSASKCIPRTSKSIPMTSRSDPMTSKSNPMTSNSNPTNSRSNPRSSKDQQTSSLTQRNNSSRHQTSSKVKYRIFDFVILNGEKRNEESLF